MTALPLAPSANAVRDAMQRLGAIQPGPYRVVSCYLKLEPRDKTRGKYLIKMKNRIREAVAALERQSLERAVRDQVGADLERIRRHFEEPGELPRTRGVALFACRTIGLFDVIPLPHVYRSRLGVDAAALVPHLHTYLHDLLLGVVKLNPKRASPAEVHEAALLLRDQRERAWERAHAEAVQEGLGTGWAVNGIQATLKALAKGQVRTLLADGQNDDARIDDAIEEALRQRVQVGVVDDHTARR